jgi:hypothetical protein
MDVSRQVRISAPERRVDERLNHVTVYRGVRRRRRLLGVQVSCMDMVSVLVDPIISVRRVALVDHSTATVGEEGT